MKLKKITVDADWRNVRNLLCVRLDNMGDIVMVTPAMRALKTSFPGCRLCLMASSSCRGLIPLLADVDEVIEFDAPWVKQANVKNIKDSTVQIVRTIREKQFDAVVIFTTYSQSPLPAAMLMFMAQIPLRLAICRENPYQLLTHWVPEQESDKGFKHEVRRQIALVGSVGCSSQDIRMRLRIREQDVQSIYQLLKGQLDISKRSWFVVHPGATASSRRYSPEGFAEAARLLIKATGYNAIFTGSLNERQLIEDIRKQIQEKTISMAGQLTVAELAALIDRAPVLITNNTLASHIASATATPVVVLYALTNLQHTPWLVANRILYHDVPCKLCYKSICPQGHHDCLRKVSPTDVFRAALSLLSF